MADTVGWYQGGYGKIWSVAGGYSLEGNGEGKSRGYQLTRVHVEDGRQTNVCMCMCVCACSICLVDTPWYN